jgi:hypothetical protein
VTNAIVTALPIHGEAVRRASGFVLVAQRSETGDIHLAVSRQSAEVEGQRPRKSDPASFGGMRPAPRQLAINSEPGIGVGI